MTQELFHQDAYARSFQGTIIEVSGSHLRFDRTAFYPSGGGQPHDTGSIDIGAHVLEIVSVSRSDGLIWHEYNGATPDINMVFAGSINWTRRLALMRTHTAVHILSAVIWRDFGAQVTGGNMEPLKARMDFELGEMSSNFAEQIEASAMQEIKADRTISAHFLERAEADRHPDLVRTKVNLLPTNISQVRVVEIHGLDFQADGGTHVASTGQVGRIRIVGHESKGKMNKRLRLVIEDA